MKEKLDIGAQIKRQRFLAGFSTQEELAKKLGVSQSLVANWENKKMGPSLRSLYLMREKLGWEFPEYEKYLLTK